MRKPASHGNPQLERNIQPPGETFSHSLFAKMAELGIDLGLCVYQDDQLADEDK
jgi:hypothetical protein